jgi:hypothetical protein
VAGEQGRQGDVAALVEGRSVAGTDRAFEAGMRSANAANPAPAPVMPIMADGTDDIASLEAAASQALTMALRTTALQVTRPSDVKALVDTANRALDLASKMKRERAANQQPERSRDAWR